MAYQTVPNSEELTKAKDILRRLYLCKEVADTREGMEGYDAIAKVADDIIPEILVRRERANNA